MGSNERENPPMKRKDLKPVGDNLGSLNSDHVAQETTPKFEIPKTPDLNNEGALEIARMAEEAEAEAKMVKDWVPGALNFLDRTKQGSRTEKEMFQKRFGTQIQEHREKLCYFLREVDSNPCRRAAWLSLLEYKLNVEAGSEDEVLDLMNDLVKEDLLVSVKNTNQKGIGPVHVSLFPYFLHPDSRFEQEEIDEVQEWLQNLVSTAEKRKITAVTQASDDLEGNRSFTADEFLKGAPGKYFFRIPAEQDKDSNWRSGGALAVEIHQADGDNDSFVTISGFTAKSDGFKKSIGEAEELKVKLPLSSLQQEEAPSFPDLSPKCGGKTRLFWFLVKRGLKNLRKKEAILASRSAILTESSITPEQFFREEEGTCLIEFEGTWRPADNGHSIPDMFFQAKRTGDSIQVQIPEHLEEYFKPCLDEMFVDTDGEFREAHHLLQPVFRAVRNAVERKTSTAPIKTEQ